MYKEENRMKKKLVAALTCAAMAVGMMAGCGDKDAASTDGAAKDGAGTTKATAESTEPKGAAGDYAFDKSWPEETVKIALETYDPTDDQFLATKAYCDYISENFNVEFMYSEAISAAEDEIAFVDSAAAAGCKAFIAMYNVAGEQQIQETIDNGMYYWGTLDYYDAFADNEKYLGTYTFNEPGSDSSENGDYIGGYQMGYNLAKQGCEHIFYCNGGASMGIGMFVDRQNGFEAGVAAANKEGASCEYDPSADIVEGWPGTDDFTAAVTAKISDKSYDGVATSFNAAAIFQPIYEGGRDADLKVAAIGEINDTYYDAVNSGLVSTVVYDPEEIIFMNAIPSVLNAVSGNADITRGSDGKAGLTFVTRWTVSDADTFNKIYDFHESGEYYVSAADVASCVKALNPDATFDTMYDLYSSLTLENAVK